MNYDAGGRAHGVMGIYSFDGFAGGQVLNNFFNLSFGDTQGTVYTKAPRSTRTGRSTSREKLALDVGVRYTDEDKRADVTNRCYTDATFATLANCAGLGTPIAASFDKSINFKNTSPKISLDYQITDDIMLYGLASRGFKSGGYNIRAQATAVPRSAEPFQDEQVDSYEVGSEDGAARPVAVPQPAYFHNKYDDIQLSVFTEYTLPDGTRRVLRRLHQRGRGHRAGPGSSNTSGWRRRFTLSRQPGVAGRAVRRVHLQERQHRRPAGLHQRTGVLRRGEPGIPRAVGDMRPACRRA